MKSVNTLNAAKKSNSFTRYFNPSAQTATLKTFPTQIHFHHCSQHSYSQLLRSIYTDLQMSLAAPIIFTKSLVSQYCSQVAAVRFPTPDGSQTSIRTACINAVFVSVVRNVPCVSVVDTPPVTLRAKCTCLSLMSPQEKLSISYTQHKFQVHNS